MPRQPYLPPSHPDGNATIASAKSLVRFHHPAYFLRPGAVPFLVLPAHERGRNQRAGLHHETARLACALVAGNRVDGYLSIDREGKNAVGADPELLLDDQDYFFQVPASRDENWQDTEGSAGSQAENINQDYPIYPDFKSWCFEQLPHYWTKLHIPTIEDRDRSPSRTRESVQARDEDTCRLSGYTGINEVAHIVPEALSRWSSARGLTQFGTGQENALLLRNDLHHAFDRLFFAFVPRQGALVAHITAECPRQLTELYHDVELQPLRGVSVEHLFCRFALTIFNIVSTRIHGNQERRLIRVSWNDGSITESDELYTMEAKRRPSPKRSARDAGFQDDLGSQSGNLYGQRMEPEGIQRSNSSDLSSRSSPAYLRGDRSTTTEPWTPESLGERKRRREDDRGVDLISEEPEESFERGRKRWRW